MPPELLRLLKQIDEQRRALDVLNRLVRRSRLWTRELVQYLALPSPHVSVLHERHAHAFFCRAK
jgi:hypothetical protein